MSKLVAETLRKALARVRCIAEQQGADRGAAECDALLETWPDHPALLIEKARLIQLSEHGKLSEARSALQRATQVDEANPECWIELGYYLLRVDDRATDAESKFDRATALALAQLADATAGKIETVLEQHPESLPADRSVELESAIRIGEALLENAENDGFEELRMNIVEARQRVRVKLERNGKQRRPS